LLTGYGFQVDKNVILDHKYSAAYWLPVGGRQGNFFRPFAPYAEVLPNGPKDILANMRSLALPFPSTMKPVGPLEPGKTDAETKVTELLRTSPESFEHTDLLAITMNLKLPPPEKGKGTGPFLVAAAASGKFKSFYADHPAPADVDLGTPTPPGQ